MERDGGFFGRKWQRLDGARGDRVSQVAGRFAPKASGESRCSRIGCGDDCGSCGVDPLDGMGDGGYDVRGEAVVSAGQPEGANGGSETAVNDGVASAQAAVAVVQSAADVSAELKEAAVVGNGNRVPAGVGGVVRRRIGADGNVSLARVGGSECAVTSRAAVPERPAFLDALKGKSVNQPVSVLSPKGGDILESASESGAKVFIIRSSGGILRGIPNRYTGPGSGFRLRVGSREKDFGFVSRNMSGRYFDIGVGDFVVYATHLGVGDVACVTRAFAGEACCGVSVAGEEKPSYPRTVQRRNFVAGSFLHKVAAVEPISARARVEGMLSPKARDIIEVLERSHPSLGGFLRVVLGFVGKRESTLNKKVAAIAEEKSFPGDDPSSHLDMAIDLVNEALEDAVPSSETKAKGITQNDHGAVIQIRKVDGGGSCCYSFVRDIQEGDSDCRCELHEFHNLVKDGVLPQLEIRSHRILVDALLFHYCGVPIDDLKGFFSKDGFMKVIESANMALVDLGVRIILNNGLAVLAKVGEPAKLLPDMTDAVGYKGRFSWYVGGSVEDAKAAYVGYRKGQISERSSRAHKFGNNERFNARLAGFVTESMKVRRSDDRVSAFAGAFRSNPHLFEVVDDLTDDMVHVHELAGDIVGGVLGTPVNPSHPYFNGRLLVSALIGQYHGVSREVINMLPFSFRYPRGDSNLATVIYKVNERIKEQGLRVYVHGNVFILGCDVGSESGVGRKVHVLGRRLPMERYPGHMVKDLRRGGRKGRRGFADENEGDVDVEVAGTGDGDAGSVDLGDGNGGGVAEVGNGDPIGYNAPEEVVANTHAAEQSVLACGEPGQGDLFAPRGCRYDPET